MGCCDGGGARGWDTHGQLHYERDLGVPIDVIDPRNYLLPKKAVPLPPEDEALLNWREGDGPGSGEESHFFFYRQFCFC